jgi:hypothetical protein
MDIARIHDMFELFRVFHAQDIGLLQVETDNHFKR